MMEMHVALTLALLVGAGNAAILTAPSADSDTSTLREATNQEDPNIVLDGLYSECVFSFNFPCLQRKTLLFIERLGRSTIFPLFGNYLTLVRTTPINGPELSEEKLRYLKGDQLADMVDSAVTDFFQNHVFRLQLPQWMIDSSSERRSGNALDFYIGDSEMDEGRGKKGGGKKGMKKMMMMMCMMVAGKMMMMGPLLLGLTKLAAIKALILSFISLTISKIIILKKLQKQKAGGGGGGGWPSGGGGGGGGGWSSGGGSGGGWQSSGGGWDRSFSNHDLVYKGYASKS